jgi:hypothetical protein
MVLAGAMLAIAITLYPEGLAAPAWVAYTCTSLFGVAGAIVLARSYERPLLADGLVCVLIAAMLVVELWIALGPGGRHCTGGFTGAVSEPTCRWVFGLGTPLVGFMLWVAVRGWLRRRSAG